MTDNVRYLRSDSPAAVKAGRDSAEAIEAMAQQLESLATQLRSGEETMQFGMVVWYNQANCCMRWALGQQTTHENVLLLTLAHTYALRDEGAL